LPPSSGFTSVPVCKVPRFNGMDYTKWAKHYKKKTYSEAHIGKEWDLDDWSSDSDSDGVATVAIKGCCSSSSKSLFPNLNKAKCWHFLATE
jgi:hypothetical protein